jgi:2-hydroxy-3-keto-5-methylthiopentenyl-1-phosphate phosphatase
MCHNLVYDRTQENRNIAKERFGLDSEGFEMLENIRKTSKSTAVSLKSVYSKTEISETMIVMKLVKKLKIQDYLSEYISNIKVNQLPIKQSN